MRAPVRPLAGAAAALLVALAAFVAGPAPARAASAGPSYVVLYAPGTADAAGRRAVVQAGGTVVRSDPAVGYAVARSAAPDFWKRVKASRRLVGAARDQSIGSVPAAAPAGTAVEHRRTGATGATPRGHDRRAARRPAVGHAADRGDRHRLVRA